MLAEERLIDTPTPVGSKPDHALVVEDDPVAGAMLRAMLCDMGIEADVFGAAEPALAAFEDIPYDFILLDVALPGINGIETARRLRALPTRRFVPIIFLTGHGDERTLEDCLAAGGDDFLPKPFTQRALSARLNALRRIQQTQDHLQSLLAAQRRDLQAAREFLEHGARQGNYDNPAILYHDAPSRGPGRLCLATRAATGNVVALLADFGSDSLAAALIALPTADIFRAMAAKGFAVGSIITAITKRIDELVPGGMCPAIQIVDIARDLDRIEVINASTTPVELTSPGGATTLCRPAGDNDAAILSIVPDSRVTLTTDGRPGITIACTEALFVTCKPARTTALVETGETAAGGWDLSFTLYGPQLRESDPVPMVVSHLRELVTSEAQDAQLFTVLTELYVNALDHGVLGLDSALKSGAEGFVTYMNERNARLARLHDGWVRIRVGTTGSARSLRISVADSGAGYDASKVLVPSDTEQPLLYGRGLALVRNLCAEVVLSGNGSETTAIYDLDSSLAT